MALNILQAFENEPPSLDFVFPAGLLSGTVGVLFSPGATGKSFWGLEAAVAVAGGDEGNEADLLGLQPAGTGYVAFFAAEDPVPVLVRRLHAIGQHLSQEAREAVAERLLLEPVVGRRIDIMDDAWLDYFASYCTGTRLTIFDTLSRIHTLDENSNGDMAGLLQRLEWLGQKTGAAILLLHHTSKAAALSGEGGEQQAARGASALLDNARWGAALTRMTRTEAESLSDRPTDRRPIGEDRRHFFVKFSVPKNNYGVPEMERWYQRVEGGVLLPVELVKAEEAKKKGGWKNI